MCQIEQKLHNLRCKQVGVKFFEGGVKVVISLPGHEFVEVESTDIEEAIDQLSFKLGIRNRSQKYRETNDKTAKDREDLRKDSKKLSGRKGIVRRGGSG